MNIIIAIIFVGAAVVTGVFIVATIGTIVDPLLQNWTDWLEDKIKWLRR